jgi:hypothetical protein
MFFAIPALPKWNKLPASPRNKAIKFRGWAKMPRSFETIKGGSKN